MSACDFMHLHVRPCAFAARRAVVYACTHAFVCVHSCVRACGVHAAARSASCRAPNLWQLDRLVAERGALTVDVADVAAALVIDAALLGTVVGRQEVGPRALGHRQVFFEHASTHARTQEQVTAGIPVAECEGQDQQDQGANTRGAISRFWTRFKKHHRIVGSNAAPIDPWHLRGSWLVCLRTWVRRSVHMCVHVCVRECVRERVRECVDARMCVCQARQFYRPVAPIVCVEQVCTDAHEHAHTHTHTTALVFGVWRRHACLTSCCLLPFVLP